MNQYIGRLLDNRYEILEVIGTGGMAVVYKALCHRLNRLVAVKILKDEFSGDEEFRRRFRAEGEAVAMLSHPNIVQVYDVSSADNANFIVMELIDGISLNQYIQSKGILNWKETLHFSLQIAQALEHAHSRGIVHRDIKPHNVMVLKNGSVKVMDFGIARVMTKSNTLTKEALGSVHYISPEQAKGGYTDNRSDLYSLSVVMYEMMAGRPPFDGDSPVAVAIQHINGGAPRPSSYNPNIPAGLEQIIMKGMALDANDRYSSATEMLRDMEEFRKNPAVVFDYTANNGTVDRLKKFPDPVKPKNTAQRVAQSKGGTLSPSRETSRTAFQDGSRYATGSVPGTGRISVQPTASSDTIRRAQLRRQQELQRKQERNRMTTFAVVTCSAVAVIAMVVFLVAIFNGALLNQERDLVDVPNLVGEIYTDELAAHYGSLSIRLRPQQYSEVYEKGRIMLQEPAGGDQVLKGTEIYITVSLGSEPAVPVMENLTGIDREQATNFLKGQGYQVLVYNEASPLMEAGDVIRTDPVAKMPLTPGQTVKLWVSTGPDIITGIMPDVTTMDKTTAAKVLEQLGFTKVSFQEVNANAAPGQVVNQSVPKQTEVDVNTEIILEISMGPAPEETKDVPQEPVSMIVSFDLPQRAEAYQISIRKGEEVILPSMEIAPGSTGVNLELTDVGTQEYEIYIDGIFYQTQKVDFTKNG